MKSKYTPVLKPEIAFEWPKESTVHFNALNKPEIRYKYKYPAWLAEVEQTKADLETLSFLKTRVHEVESENLRLRLAQASDDMLYTERRRLADEIAGIDGECRSLAKEAEGWRLRCYQFEREKAVWENRLMEQDRAVTEAKDRQAQAEAGQVVAQKEAVELRQKLADSTQYAQRLETLLKDSEAKCVRLEVQVHDLGKDLKEFGQRELGWNAREKQLRQEIEDLTGAHRRSEEHCNALQERNSTLILEFGQRESVWNVREKQLQRENEDLNGAHRRSEEHCKALQERNSTLSLSLDRFSGREIHLADENSQQRKRVENLENANKSLRLDLQNEITRSFFEKDPEYVESVVVRSPSTGRRRHLACDHVSYASPYEWPVSPPRSRLDYPRSARSRLLRDEVLQSRQLTN